jgi:hypothetical protein
MRHRSPTRMQEAAEQPSANIDILAKQDRAQYSGTVFPNLCETVSR